MARVLLIDDEPIYFKMIVHALKPHGYEVEYARTGLDGLKAVPIYNPDVIITDVRLPDLSGYEVAQRLRRDTRYENIPLIFLTSQADLSNKLKAFEVGADDYLSKPFQPEELVARVGMLVRRGEALRSVRKREVKDQATVVAVHSLRGGVGNSTMAVNLGMAFYRIWERPTLVIDAVLNAGQVALMLNASPHHTWEDLAEVGIEEVDTGIIESLASKHASGMNYIAAPVFPIALDSLTDDVWQSVLTEFSNTFDFIVIDVPHDFSNVAIHMLNHAEHILMMLSPDMASIRAAVCALNIYDKLNYPPERILPVLNNLSSQPGIRLQQVEKVLKRPMTYAMPYTPVELNRALNFGDPFVAKNPDLPITAQIEDIAYALTKESLKNIPPAASTAVWKRVTTRVINKK